MFLLTHFRVKTNHICGVMVSMLAKSAIDRGFEPRSGQTKDYKIGICCFSAKQFEGVRVNIGWLGIRIIKQNNCSFGVKQQSFARVKIERPFTFVHQLINDNDVCFSNGFTVRGVYVPRALVFCVLFCGSWITPICKTY